MLRSNLAFVDTVCVCVFVRVCVCAQTRPLIIWQVYHALCIHMAEFKRFAEFPPEGCPWVFAHIYSDTLPDKNIKRCDDVLKLFLFFFLRSGSEA